MATINRNYDKLGGGYLFSEITRRTKAFQEKHPSIMLLRLGIGNTTQSLTPTVIKGLQSGVEKLADAKTYTGYGDERGDIRLRFAFANWYKERGINLTTSEIFISDGAKPDTANIQSIFGQNCVVAVSDPAYPVYVDTAIIGGRKIVYMPCIKDNGFIPSLPKGKVDIIYICSPNNPTGAVVTKKQLQAFVDYAIKYKAVIVFDAAYSEYITDKNLPKSIYEIPGAKKCAIEISSFSKWAGFTGVRLGWTVVPIDLVVEGSEKGKVNSLWNRRQITMFNGASNIAQEGGLAVLSEKGQKESKELISYYMKNAAIIKKGFSKIGLQVFGGENAPYIWLKTPQKMSSWDFFDKLLNEAHVVGTPGVGFGPQGEGYFRLSAFGNREQIEKAIKSIQENLKL
ncbi:MAG: LL-diaminopimelate aminotransferase [Candidatus Levyibacteriota bacterium]|nr:MAG: LL-diaminopimelate aminotransferase [Candidatus Levybacteria bacterium]